MRCILKQNILYMVMVLLAFAFFRVYSASSQEDQIDTMTRKILVILQPFKTATLSAEVSSVVTKIRHEMGRKFKKNVPLIDLDPELYFAEKKKADALLTFAATAYETNHKLYNQQSISEVEFAKVKANLEVAKSNVAIAKKKLTACSVRSPYPGRVVKLLVNEKEWVQQGQPLIEIVDDRIIRAKFLIPSGFYGHIQRGQLLDVHVRKINRRITCKITHISPVLESNTSTFQVFSEIDNSENIIRAGMTGEILLKITEGE